MPLVNSAANLDFLHGEAKRCQMFLALLKFESITEQEKVQLWTTSIITHERGGVFNLGETPTSSTFSLCKRN
jgi:hypothetical protein